MDFQELSGVEVRHFLKKLCVVSSRYAKRQHAAQKLNDHLNKLKKISSKKQYHNDLSELQNKISNYVALEKEIRFHEKQESEKEKKLQQHILELESELERTKLEKDQAIQQNKEHIETLNATLSAVKKKMNAMMKEQQARNKRKLHLEEKISKKVKLKGRGP